MAMYATIDATGNATGFYDDAVSQTLPADAIAITDEQWAVWSADADAFVWDEAAGDITPAPDVLDRAKETAKGLVKLAFAEALEAGFDSPAAGTVIGCRRVDLENMRSLLEHMQRNGITATQFRVKDNGFITVDQAKLDAMIAELVAHGLWMYEHKWDLEQQVDAATSQAEVDAVAW